MSFTSIYPACYSGRWPHAHFEIYAGLDDATPGGRILATSELALPADVCATGYATTGYATTGYEQGVANLAQTSLERDNVFGDDGGVRQLATVSGGVDPGYTCGSGPPVCL